MRRPVPFGGMMKVLLALAGCLLALVCQTTTPAGAKPSPPPVAQQDSARATGDAPTTTSSFFNIDISAQSGPSGENPVGHGSDKPVTPSGALVAGPVSCLQVIGNVASTGFTYTGALRDAVPNSACEGLAGRSPAASNMFPRNRK